MGIGKPGSGQTTGNMKTIDRKAKTILFLLVLIGVLTVWPGSEIRGGIEGLLAQLVSERGDRDSSPLSGSAGGEHEVIVDAVERIGSAIVKLSVRQVAFVDSLFGRTPTEEEGLGSGVIFDQNGLILTNHHVVRGADRIIVSLPDGRQFEGKVVGSFPESDLAVVRIPSDDNLPQAELGDSSTLLPGQQVIAIGNPFGFDYSVTTGIVSALGRELVTGGEDRVVLQNLVQTDAAINPGNSGGPLVDRNGRVVGINTAVVRSVQGFEAQGLGFAIPINDAVEVAKDIVRYGNPPRLGILGGTLTPSVARAIERSTGESLGATQGVFVREVFEGTPASKAGLEPTDIITHGDGRAITSVEELRAWVRNAGPEGTITLDVLRRGRSLKVMVPLG